VYETDIGEAPTRHVHQKPPEIARPALRYGTIGSGLDVGRLVWPRGHHVFSSQTTSLEKVLPRRPTTRELGPPDRVLSDQLQSTPVDVLLVDVTSGSHWERWLQGVSGTKFAPKVIAQSLPPGFLSDKEKEAEWHSRGKRLQRLGYGVSYWYLRAHEFGAALHQDRCFTVYHCLQHAKSPPIRPQPDGLPPRSMANLLTPVGVPRGAFSTGLGEACTRSPFLEPCRQWGNLGSTPVYSIKGLMPDDLSAYIHVRGRCRRLQSEELAKAKGSPSEWNAKPVRKVPATPASLCTSLHLWAAVGDSVAVWCNLPPPFLTKAAVTPKDRQAPATLGPTTAMDQDEFVAWTLPDLSLGGSWYLERMASLKIAVSGLPDEAHWLVDGQRALDTHRQNYTAAGPLCLQLLWWEFPPEHWEALRLGSSMNFLIEPSGALELNSEMDEAQLDVAARFVDELVALGVLVEATENLRANGPLFLVPKPGQPGEWRCISDMKRGGQNACMGKDPTFLPRAPDILPRLYIGGYSAVADASKHFYNFPTRPNERPNLGCIHPKTLQQLWYVGLPMGSANSPAIACRLGNSGLRLLQSQSRHFQGTATENSWRQSMGGETYHPRFGHGRVLIGADGLPAALLFAHVDDYFIHGPTLRKTCLAFNDFMDLSVRLGIICQAIKTRPPSQQQKFCGFLYDTTGVPTLVIPPEKVSKAIASIQYLRSGSATRHLARLTLAVVIGRLQSLVDATPQQIGNSYLRLLYDELHALEARGPDGRLSYFSVIELSEAAWLDLDWWMDFLSLNPGATGVSGQSGTLVSTWGNGSGTGAGGTLEIHQPGVPIAPMRIWMGTWAPEIHHFSSNWRELRTLYQTLWRERTGQRLYRSTVFYFTDNLVSYYIMHSGSSPSTELHKLVLQIKRLELSLNCRLEVIHVPGTLMIHQGTDGLSRGLWMAPERTRTTSLLESSHALASVPFSWPIARWAETIVGLPHGSITHHFGSLDSWDFDLMRDRWTIWTPTPEIARHAMATFLDHWVEVPLNMAAVFLVPRVLQRSWSRTSHSVLEYPATLPRSLPFDCRYDSDIPFVLLVILPHVRRLDQPRLDTFAADRAPYWIQAQVEGLHRL
jgi:hypothetical protein